MLNQIKTAVKRAATAAPSVTTRRMAGGHSASHKYTSAPEQPAPGKLYSYGGTAMGAVMWFWILWRAKQDLPHLLGFEHPWDHLPSEHGEESHH